MIEKIFFLPYAGGSKYAYRNYIKLLPPQIIAVTPELPGRGSRMDELPLDSLDELICSIYEQIKQETDCRYVIYGHSMGSLLGFLLTQKIVAANQNPPLFLCFTGCRAPSTIAHRNLNVHLLGEEDFWKAILAFGSLPIEVLEDQELRSMIEAPLRADFKVVETYRHMGSPVNSPVLVINGESEHITDAELNNWHVDATEKVVIKKFKGNHFFFLGQEHLVMAELFQFYDQLNFANQCSGI
jgi:surfactin synthase thioesterase subunit